MLSVRAIYDGQELKLMEKVRIRNPRQVIITFLDTLESDPPADEMHKMVQEGGALDFLDDEREDIYSDDDLKANFLPVPFSLF